MRNYLLLLGLAATFTFTSCDKDDDVPAKTKSDFLTAGSWKVSNLSIDIDNDGTADGDLTGFIAACSKDDLTIFRADKTYTYDEGASKCDPADPQIQESGTWAFSGDETKLLLTPAGTAAVETYSLVELNENTMKFNKTESDSTGTYTVMATFTH